MNQNKIIAFFSLLFLGLVYLVCTLFVWLSRGRNGFFLAGKLKTGARIIMLSGILSILSCESCTTPQVLCYKPAPENYFLFTTMNEENELIIDGDGDRIITGKVGAVQANTYTFTITGNEGTILQQGKVEAVDGAIDNDPEDIRIMVSERLSPGTYVLNIFTGESHEDEYLVYVRNIVLK